MHLGSQEGQCCPFLETLSPCVGPGTVKFKTHVQKAPLKRCDAESGPMTFEDHVLATGVCGLQAEFQQKTLASETPEHPNSGVIFDESSQ